MKRLQFDSQGKLAGLDGNEIGRKDKPKHKPRINLKKSDSLDFLKEDSKTNLENIFEKDYWNLNDESGPIPPLKFSNEKTQEDIVKEILDLIEQGNKVIFLHGTCGTGKSAIALNIARVLGKTSVVVPVKNLQKQYEEDYMGNKFLIKPDGKKMKIAMMTGRSNHDSLIEPGVSCADPNLPENIKITEKNYNQLVEYHKENPFLSGNNTPELKNIRRLTIAPANPYWSPIIPSSFELGQLKDAKKIKYLGADGKEYIFYHRKPGCSYYDQYLAYKKADVIIFNAAKYKAEMSLGRKPMTEVEIIDEADEFLDGLFQQEELNLTRLGYALTTLVPDSLIAKEIITEILDLIKLEEQNKRATGIDEENVFKISETKILEMLELFVSNTELEAEIAIDELNYSNKALETARNFKENLKDTYLTYRKDEDNLLIKLVSTNLSSKINDLMNKSKTIVFMSGTLHSENVLKNIFGIKEFVTVEAETLNQGAIEILRTGKEFDCKHANFASERYSRKDYLRSLEYCLEKSETPSLIHVNAYMDLPSEQEKIEHGIFSVSSREKLRHTQMEDKTGRLVSIFKQGLSDTLFTTKCSRGVDFPGDTCKSVIFTKYPYPNVKDTFWKILKETHPDDFWEFYKDKSYREFLQRIYRAIRSTEDHVYILSPDIRVFQAVRKLQEQMIKN